MSRIGKQPIPVPSGVTIDLKPGEIRVKGPKGELSRPLHRDMIVTQSDGTLVVTRPTDQQQHRALHGLTRALVANMVTGVSNGFQKILIFEGTGYRAEVDGKDLVCSLGFSHPVRMPVPKGLTMTVEDRGKRLIIAGADNELLGETCVRLRKLRPPEPYKGKGIRFEGEQIRRKAGKAGKAGKK